MQLENPTHRLRLHARLAAAAVLPAALVCLGAAPAAAQALDAKHKVLDVAAGKLNACALVDDGSVRCWGFNSGGELGNGKKSPEPMPPVPVQGISGAKRLFWAGGDGSTVFCAQMPDGKTSCWGSGYAMPLEKGQSTEVPVPVPTLDGVKDVAGAYNNFACAVMPDDTVACWGRGAFGVLGNGSDEDKRVPTAVSGLSGVVDLATGQNHVCAATKEGKVYCWGYNSSHQVDPKAESRDPVKTPVEVAGVTDAVAVGAYGSTSCARLKDGSTVCWGSNFYEGPKPLEGVGTVKTLSGSDSHACAINTDGQLYCWGNNWAGQLGAGLKEQQSYNDPQHVTALSNVTAVSTGDMFTCAVTAAGDVHCWGKNENGQLGVPKLETANVPQVIAHARAGLEALQANIAKAEQLVADERASLTPEKYEELLLALADCSLTDSGIDSKCEAKKAYDKARSRNTAIKDMAGLYASLGAKHIGHASPAVRLEAASYMSSIFGASADSQKVLLDAAARETDPVVLRSILRAVGSSMGKNPGVYDLVMKSTEHPDEKVRIQAVSSLASWGGGKEGALERVLHLIEHDPSMDVRKYACDEVGEMEDERALPLLEKLTGDPGTDPALYSECMEGLFAMWSGVTKPDKPSEKAYRLTLKRLNETPRTEKRPPWTLMSDFGWCAPSRADDKFYKEWAAKATWYKPEELLAALEAVVTDRQAYWMARTGAVEAMLKLGTPKAKFEKLVADFEAVDGQHKDDSHVLRKLKESVSKAPAN